MDSARGWSAMVLCVMVPGKDFPRIYRLNKLKPLLSLVPFLTSVSYMVILGFYAWNHWMSYKLT